MHGGTSPLEVGLHGTLYDNNSSLELGGNCSRRDPLDFGSGRSGVLIENGKYVEKKHVFPTVAQCLVGRILCNKSLYFNI